MQNYRQHSPKSRIIRGEHLMLELTASMPDEFVTELQYLIEIIIETEGD